jgi:hypothetical protein
MLFAVGLGGFNVRVIVVAAYVDGVARAALIDATVARRNKASILLNDVKGASESYADRELRI